MVLGGLDECGEWTMKQGKEYPYRLCYALASSYLHYFKECHVLSEDANTFPAAPSEWPDVLRDLTSPFDPYLLDACGTVMRNDYVAMGSR